MPKKNLIEEALIEAKELERASIDNAKDIVLESFTPDFIDFFKDVLTESDDKDEDDVEIEEGEKPTFKKGEKPDFGKKEDDDEELDEADHKEPDGDEVDGKEPKGHDEELEEGNEHDVGKEPDAGRQGTDPAVDDSEESLPQDQKDDPMKEGKYDDVSGDATPEKGQAGLPKKGQPKTKKVGDKGWEAEHSGGEEHADTQGSADPEKAPGDLPGKKPAVKQTGDGGWEDEGASGAEGPDPEKGGKNGLNVPTPPVKVAEADGDKEEKELEVPDELFDDEDEIKEADEPKVKDDSDIDDDDVEINIDVDKEDDDKEEVDENLYIRQEGEFKKITPAEYLQSRISTLEEEVEQYKAVAETLQGQLQETHLFNAKLAHLNKLYMSGAFTNKEKERIAERLDECDSIDDVKSLYKTIISEVQETNPLDDFSNLIKEQRIRKDSKTENIYESTDVSRMKRIMNYEFE